MNDTMLVSIVTFIYFAGALGFLIALVFNSSVVERLSLGTAISGFVLHSAALALRWIISYQQGIGHAPLSNFYESLVFFSWAIVFVYLLSKKHYKTRMLGILACFISFVVLAYASLSGKVECRIQPLIPALQSNWLISHVVSSFLAYACFAIAFGTSVLFFFAQKTDNKHSGRMPDMSALDEITYKMISIGFVLLTTGIMTGAVWADRAWGRYWGWDPKETWSLITWLIYGAFLHARLARGWKGVRMSVISIIGFVAVIFTYLGVNYILAGLHSYL